MGKKNEVPCPDCGGRGSVAFGDTEQPCAGCGGKGTVKG